MRLFGFIFSITTKASKRHRAYYLSFAALAEYFFTVRGNKSPFKTYADLCRWLEDEKSVFIDPVNWSRDWKGIYTQLQQSCMSIDYVALEPVEKELQKGYIKKAA